MPGPHPRALRSKLALAVASGKSVAAWAKENGIALRTAYEWHRDPAFKAQVDEVRRRFFDRAIGQLSRSVVKAVTEMARLTTKAKSDAVRLQAARAVVADLMAMSDFAAFEKRMAAIEKQLQERAGGATRSS